IYGLDDCLEELCLLGRLGYDDAAVATSDLADWRDVASDDRDSGGQGFQGGSRKALPQRWQQENIGGAKQLRDIVAFSQKPEGLREASASHCGLHVRAKRTVTGEHELGPGHFCRTSLAISTRLCWFLGTSNRPTCINTGPPCVATCRILSPRDFDS